MFLRSFDFVDQFPYQSCKGPRPHCLCQGVRQTNSCIIQCAGYNLGDTCNVKTQGAWWFTGLLLQPKVGHVQRTCSCRECGCTNIRVENSKGATVCPCVCPELHVEERIEGLNNRYIGYRSWCWRLHYIIVCTCLYKFTLCVGHALNFHDCVAAALARSSGQSSWSRSICR